MGSFDALLYTPTIPAILRSLAETPEGKDESDFDVGPSERQYVSKAIQALLEHGLITRDEGTLRLTKKTEYLEKVERLLEFYDDVQKQARIRLTFRGILNATQYRCLVHLHTFMEMMGQEGFDNNEVDGILAKEKSAAV